MSKFFDVFRKKNLNNESDFIGIPTKKVALFSKDEVDLILHPPIGANKKLNRKFTEIIAKLFQSQGYKILNTDGFKDNGGDLRVEKNSNIFAIQIKHINITANNQNIKPTDIKNFYATKKLTHADNLIFLTTGYFSKYCFQTAQDLGIELIDREKLFELFAQFSPTLISQIAYRYSLEELPSCPSCMYGKVRTMYNHRYYYYCIDCEKTFQSKPTTLKK